MGQSSLGIVCLEGGLQIERQAYPLTFDKAPINPIVCFPMPNLNREGYVHNQCMCSVYL